MKQFSRQWWDNKTLTHKWCDEFCTPFFEQDPSLRNDPLTYDTIGIVFFQKPDGETVPAGFTALQGNQFVFQYHPAYLEDETLPALCNTLPKQEERFTSNRSLQSFFDNLTAEGWFGEAQIKALNRDPALEKDYVKDSGNEAIVARYNRLMMFGRDCPGAFWLTYIKNDPEIAQFHHQATIEEALQSRSSIPGVQPKLLGVVENGKLRPTHYWETSTHIVKMPPVASSISEYDKEEFRGIMEYEYMSLLATKALLPHDQTADASLSDLHLRNGDTKQVLAIRRFDRTAEGGRIHFNELNQILDQPNAARYEGFYSDMAKAVDKRMGKEGVQLLYARIITQFLLGNVDGHFKNFAMFPDSEGYTLTPNYDLAPGANYGHDGLALRMRPAVPIEGTELMTFRGKGIEYKYDNLKSRVLVNLGLEFGLNPDEIKMTMDQIQGNIEAAKEAVRNDPSPSLDDSRKKSSTTTYRDDFCRRLDSRAHKLFFELDREIARSRTFGID